MTELMDKALDRVRLLSSEKQDEVARIMLRLVGDEDAVDVLSQDEEADLIAAEVEIARGELATQADVEAVLRMYRA